MTVHDLARWLPDARWVRDRCRAMAMCEAIIAPGSDYRRHRYDADWRPGVELAVMDNGAGDTYRILFTSAGALMFGLDHHSPMSPYERGDLWPGVVDSVPAEFAGWLTEPSFLIDGILAASFCLWWRTGDTRWCAGTIDFPEEDPHATVGDVADDGADWVAGMLGSSPEYYQDWAKDYYARAVDVGTVRRMFAMEPLTEELVASINPALSLAGLGADVARTRYPVGA